MTATSTGYKATIEPPTGKTAKELVDELPNGADIWVKDLLNAADATLKVTAVGFCVEPSDGSACGGGGDDPCFSREAEACRIVDTSVAPFAAFRACFDDAAPTVAERVKMTALTGGDYILSAGKDQAYEFTRVIVNQHKLTEARRPATPAHHSPMGLAFALAPSPPPLSVSPPPPPLYPCRSARACSRSPTPTVRSSSRRTTCCWSTASGPPRTPSRSPHPPPSPTPSSPHARSPLLTSRPVQVGSSLSGSKVTAISHGVGGIINPVTVSGMIVAAGATGGPVISSAYPEWIAEYMLEQNNGYYPLPVSMSSMLAYFFPATVQAYWDEVLEHAFAANQKALNAIPTPFVAPIMFVLDLVCSAGLLLFALANAKVIATLVAVVAVARARRVAKA